MDLNAADYLDHVLILTPYGKDAQHLKKVLEGEGFKCRICESAERVIAESSSGVGVILTTEEVLKSAEGSVLTDGLRQQPSWSAIPLLVFYTPRDTRDSFQRKLAEPIHEVSNISFLERPVSSLTLSSAVRAAFRDRMRQYASRDLLTRLEEDILHRAAIQKDLENARDDAQKAKKQAEAANESKSRFLANMSHEIRTPLGAMLGFAELLRDPRLDEANKQAFIERIIHNGHALSELINDILDLSKVEAGKIDLENVTFPLQQLLGEVSDTLGVMAAEKDIALDFEEVAPLPHTITSDMGRMRQILLNIIGNAVKFTKAGHVRVVVSAVPVGDTKAATLVFTVHDTGRGIATKDQQNLFQPFVQGDSSTTRKFGGTGLGLVLSKRLAEALGGTVRLLRSHAGEGSTFEISLPVGIAEDMASTGSPGLNAEEARGELSGVRVLVADDSPDNQILVRAMLSKRGAIVSFASNGREAVDRASQEDYDVVLMDVQMPMMDGHAATQELRRNSYKRPIVALTAHAMKEERDRCTLSGCNDYLTKPIDNILLVKTVARWATIQRESIH